MRATITANGGADPAVAWSRYEHLDLWSTWSPQIPEVIAATRRIRSGLAGLVVGPLGIRLPFEVLAVDAEVMEWSWHVRLGPVHATLDHVVRPRPEAAPPSSSSTGRPSRSSAIARSRPSPCAASSGPTSSGRRLPTSTYAVGLLRSTSSRASLSTTLSTTLSSSAATHRRTMSVMSSCGVTATRSWAGPSNCRGRTADPSSSGTGSASAGRRVMASRLRLPT